MTVYIGEVTLETEKGVIYNITEAVKEVVEKSGIKNGICLVFAPHATGILSLGEFEPRIASDYIKFLEEIAPEGGGWEHDKIDNNAHAHLRSFAIGSSVCIPIVNGELLLGTWQSIIFVEADGNRHRRFIVDIVGEKE